MAESPRSNKSSTSAFPNAATSELQGLSDHLDKRLNGLSEKIDVVLGELLKLSRETPTLRPLGPPGPPGPGPPGPPGPPGRSNRSSQQSLYSHQSFLSKQSSARGQWTSPRVNKKNMALKLAERSESSICPSETSSGKEYAKMSPKSHRPLSLRGIRAMDLDFARRLHAKEVCQEVVGAEKDMKPFMRLFQQSRADGIWELLDDPRSSIAAWLLSQLLKMMVVMSVVLTTLQVSEAPVLESTGGQVADLTFNVVFFVEFLLRILSTPSKKLYLLDPLNLGDILSAFGLPLHASIGFVWSLEPRNSSRYQQVVLDLLLLFMPLARLLKLLRYFESFRLLVDAFAKSAEALPVLVFVTSFIVMLSGTLIYIVEDRSNIPTMPHYLWLALVTMTTVGYGDYFPKSIGGYLTVSVLTFTSVLFLALPVGIIGYEFTVSWQKRGEMYLKMRLRNSLAKWGYGIDDLEILFEYADVDDDGQLVLGEFIELIRQLRIGVNVESAAALFHLLDSDHNGMVDRGEFLRHIFPDEYAKHTQQITDETLSKSRRRIGVALERLESYNQIATAGLPVDPVPEEPFSLVLRSPNVTPERQESEAAARATSPTAAAGPTADAVTPPNRIGLRENQFSL